jgi:hypothetical protein
MSTPSLRAAKVMFEGIDEVIELLLKRAAVSTFKSFMAMEAPNVPATEPEALVGASSTNGLHAIAA